MAFADIRDATNRDLAVIFPVAGVLIVLILAVLLRALLAPIYLVIDGGGWASRPRWARRATSSRALGPRRPHLHHADHPVPVRGGDRDRLQHPHDRPAPGGGPRRPRPAGGGRTRHRARRSLGGRRGRDPGRHIRRAARQRRAVLQSRSGFAVALGILLVAFVMSLFLVPATTALLGPSRVVARHRRRPRAARFRRRSRPCPSQKHVESSHLQADDRGKRRERGGAAESAGNVERWALPGPGWCATRWAAWPSWGSWRSSLSASPSSIARYRPAGRWRPACHTGRRQGDRRAARRGQPGRDQDPARARTGAPRCSSSMGSGWPSSWGRTGAPRRGGRAAATARSLRPAGFQVTGADRRSTTAGRVGRAGRLHVARADRRVRGLRGR